MIIMATTRKHGGWQADTELEKCLHSYPQVGGRERLRLVWQQNPIH